MTEQGEEQGEEEEEDDDLRQQMSSQGRSICSSLIAIPRHETAAPLFHQCYDELSELADETLSTTSTTNNSRRKVGTPPPTGAADATQSRWHDQQSQQPPPRAIPSKSAFLQSIHEEEVLASRRRQQGPRHCFRGPSRPWFVHGCGRHSSWCCYGLAIAIIIVSCGSCVLMLARWRRNKNKGRRDDPTNTTTGSFSSSASSSDNSTLQKSSTQPRLFLSGCAIVASSCLAHFPTAVEILADLFSWTGRPQQQNVPDESERRRIGGGESDERYILPNNIPSSNNSSSSSSGHDLLCTSGHDTDDSEETLCSGGGDEDDDDTTPHNKNTIFTSFSDETMAWIANHIERNETIHNTSFVDRETPLTGQAINFFHHFRFDEAGIEWM
jgi:hypothetical protein